MYIRFSSSILQNNEQENSDLQGGDELRKVYKYMIFLIYVESPVDKSSIRGLRDTTMAKPAKDWFGMSPQFVRTIADIDISRLHADRDACKGSTNTPEGQL